MNSSPVIMFATLVTLLALSFPFVRYSLRKFQSKKWPTVLATIERYEVRSSAHIDEMPMADRSFFNYKFVVDGKSYFGQFFIFAESYAALQLQQELDGQTISVKYKPGNPHISVLANTWDRRYQGREASQDPRWLTAGGGSDIVTLNLTPPATPKPPDPPQT